MPAETYYILTGNNTGYELVLVGSEAEFNRHWVDDANASEWTDIYYIDEAGSARGRKGEAPDSNDYTYNTIPNEYGIAYYTISEYPDDPDDNNTCTICGEYVPYDHNDPASVYEEYFECMECGARASDLISIEQHMKDAHPYYSPNGELTEAYSGTYAQVEERTVTER